MRVEWEEGLTYEQILSPDAKGELVISIHRHLDGKLLKVMKTKADPAGNLEISVDVPMDATKPN